ncbi:MAG: hypothetical protein LBL91_02125 [Lachnospiraceae bacterium]|jgi:glucose-6-phosphate isomerase|nr:hypothetical protein [Lachnospiraceae bacterium]
MQEKATQSYNDALNYAIALNEQSVRGKALQYFITNDTAAGSLLNWLVQLYCESSRKDDKGLFGAKDVFSEALHYNGQGVQESGGLITETFVILPQPNGDNPIYQKYAKYNKAMVEGTIAAHLNGRVGVQAFYLDQTIYDIGYFMQTHMFACVTYCYMVGVNPFDQPGVESYKAEMRKFLENS